LGQNKKVAIVVDSKEDLKSLEEYDINKIIADLNKNKHGKINLDEKKDTTYYLHRKKADVNIHILNYEIEIKSDDFDDMGDDIEDFMENYWDNEKEEKIEEAPSHQKFWDLDLGMNNWLEGGEISNDKLYGVKPWGSWYVAIMRRHKLAMQGKSFVQIGYGINWYNWKFENRNARLTEDENGVVFSEDNSVQGLKSKLTASFINLEIIPMIDYAEGKKKSYTTRHKNMRVTRYKKVGLRMGIGPYIGYRLGSKTKVVYKVNGDKRKDKEHDNFYLNNLRYGLKAQIGYNQTDFFISYDFNRVFSSGKGPKLNAISFGVIL
jgi:hypothetical protein